MKRQGKEIPDVDALLDWVRTYLLCLTEVPPWFIRQAKACYAPDGSCAPRLGR